MARTTTKKTGPAKAHGGTVRMVRDAEKYPVPHEADVHPAEVENYASGGWVKA